MMRYLRNINFEKKENKLKNFYLMNYWEWEFKMIFKDRGGNISDKKIESRIVI